MIDRMECVTDANVVIDLFGVEVANGVVALGYAAPQELSAGRVLVEGAWYSHPALEGVRVFGLPGALGLGRPLELEAV